MKLFPPSNAYAQAVNTVELPIVISNVSHVISLSKYRERLQSTHNNIDINIANEQEITHCEWLLFHLNPQQ